MWIRIGSLRTVRLFLGRHWIGILTFASVPVLNLCMFLSSDEGMRWLQKLLALSDERKDAIQVWVSYGVVALIVASFLLAILGVVRASNDLGKEEVIRGLRDQAILLKGDIKHVISAYLTGFARHTLKFDEKPLKGERITMYVHNGADGDGCFIPIGRYSQNANYNRDGRASYPDNEGFIAKVWANGNAFINDYPDPQANLDAYVARCTEDGLPPETVRSLKMKSVLFYGYRILDEQELRQLAIIIVESTSRDAYTKSYLDNRFNNQERKYLFRRLAQRVKNSLDGPALPG